ncbi:MAG: helix-turn-helix transcriptional regulator [Chloroflexota bacterium]
MSLNAEEFGWRIRQAREGRGLSQDELAIRMGKDQRAISEYELGKRRLAALDLPRLARELGVTVGYFFEETTEDELEQVLLSEFRNLPNRSAKQAVIEIARAFSGALFKQSRDIP